MKIEQETRKFTVERNSVVDFKTEFPSQPQKSEGTFLNFRSDFEEPKESYRRIIIIPVKDPDMVYPTSILEFAKNHMKFDIDKWDRQSSLMGIPFLSTKGMFVELIIKQITFHFYALEPPLTLTLLIVPIKLIKIFLKNSPILSEYALPFVWKVLSK